MSRRLGFAVLGLLLVLRLLSALSGYDPVADLTPELRSAGPSASHWLGTDHLGRDVARRLLHGTAAFVEPGLLAALLTVGIGLAAGVLSGARGGVSGAAAAWLMGVVAAIPGLVLVLLGLSIYGGSADAAAGSSQIWWIAGFCGVICAPALSGAVTARLQALIRAEFVVAARAHGISPARILFYHLLWVNTRGLVLRHALRAFTQMVVLETTLSYLGGFGVPEPTPSWGNMLAFELGVVEGNPWAWLAPALAIWLGVVGIYGLSEATGEANVG